MGDARANIRHKRYRRLSNAGKVDKQLREQLTGIYSFVDVCVEDVRRCFQIFERWSKDKDINQLIYFFDD